MSSITLYHNPRCSKSRNALELLRQHGIEPQVVEYLKNPPTAAELEGVLNLLGMDPRQLMRKGEAIYKEAGLDDPGLDHAALVAALAEHPILIERPIALGNGKAALGRPPENVLNVL